MEIKTVPGKPGRSPGRLIILGWLLALCTLAMVIKAACDSYQEGRHARWPSAVATITGQAVREYSTGRHEAWRIESEVSYLVDGARLTSTVHSRVGGFTEERTMRAWVARHPPGTSLSIRYDPERHDTAWPDAPDMPESEPQVSDDLKAVLMFLSLSVASIAMGRVLQRRRGS